MRCGRWRLLGQVAERHEAQGYGRGAARAERARRGAAAYGVAYMASENPISKENNTLWQHTTEHIHVTEEGGGWPAAPRRGCLAGRAPRAFPQAPPLVHW